MRIMSLLIVQSKIFFEIHDRIIFFNGNNILLLRRGLKNSSFIILEESRSVLVLNTLREYFSTSFKSISFWNIGGVYLISHQFRNFSVYWPFRRMSVVSSKSNIGFPLKTWQCLLENHF